MSMYVFFTNQYLPKPGATGICVHHLAKTLVERGNDVYTIAYEDDSSCSKCDGVKIKRIKIPFYLKEIINANRYVKKTQLLLSLLNKLMHLKKYPLRSIELVKRYMKCAENIIEKESFVVIVASYAPIEAVIAAMKVRIKYPNKIRIVYYSTDTLSNEQGEGGFLSPEYRTKCGLKWEEKLFHLKI